MLSAEGTTRSTMPAGKGLLVEFISCRVRGCCGQRWEGRGSEQQSCLPLMAFIYTLASKISSSKRKIGPKRTDYFPFHVPNREIPRAKWNVAYIFNCPFYSLQNFRDAFIIDSSCSLRPYGPICSFTIQISDSSLGVILVNQHAQNNEIAKNTRSHL